jgi:competence protein ComEC
MTPKNTAGLCFTLGLGVVLAFWIFRFETWFRSELRVIVLDVGQGDGIWIQFPNGATWLVDTGGKQGRTTPAATVIIPELASEAIFQIDRVVLTHTDQDHAFGVLDLLARLRIGQISVNARFQQSGFRSHLLDSIENLAHSQQVKMDYVGASERVRLGGVEVQMVPISLGRKKNNQVLVLHLEYQGCTFAFLGDAEHAVEQQVARSWKHPVDVLKVAHHGSKTSTIPTLLQRLRPQLAVISVGAKNPYGHPHPSVVRRLHRFNATVLRTDRHGYLEFRSTAEGTLQCRSHQGWCGEYFCRAKGVLDPSREDSAFSYR